MQFLKLQTLPSILSESSLRAMTAGRDLRDVYALFINTSPDLGPRLHTGKS